MRDYNGFTPRERMAVCPVQNRAFAAGFPRPPYCLACGETKGIFAHLEDYSMPLEGILGLCRACHFAVHIRFTRPETFARRHAEVRGKTGRPEGDILADIAAGLYHPTPTPHLLRRSSAYTDALVVLAQDRDTLSVETYRHRLDALRVEYWDVLNVPRHLWPRT